MGEKRVVAKAELLRLLLFAVHGTDERPTLGTISPLSSGSY
jgi:hypothetical protein